jgi:hypothetical protein
MVLCNRFKTSENSDENPDPSMAFKNLDHKPKVKMLVADKKKLNM